MPHSYSENFQVLHFECDPWQRMSPASVLRRVQEAGTAHCESLGLGDELYQRTGTAFLLAKLSLLVLARMPHLGEAVTVHTQAYGMRRAVYHRVTALHAQNGDKLCEADSRWVLVDVEARRILRKPLEEFTAYFNGEPDAAGMHPMEMPKPGELLPLGELCAGYSVCDRNGHVNNTRYVDMMCDHLPLEKLKQAPPRQVLACYHNEIPLGGSFSLQSALLEDGGFYFAARRGESRDFEGLVRF